MSDVNFYQISNSSTFGPLCNLIQKAYSQAQCINIRTDSIELADEIDEKLWTFDPLSFLPHSKFGDSNSESSPVYVTYQHDNPNKATFLFLIQATNVTIPEILKFKRTFILFTQFEEVIIKSARKMWLDLEQESVERKFWVQRNDRWSLSNFN